MSTFEYILLFGSVIIGGSAFFVFRNPNPKSLKLALSFSGAYLFGITVIHLIPEVYSSSENNIGIFILAGFVFQILLELFSEGIEHGHIHTHNKKAMAFPIAVIISLCVHSFLEGMPLAENIAGNAGHSLLAGIVLHHAPVAFALMTMLYSSGAKTSTSIMILTLFAAMSPLGALTSSYLSITLVENISSYFDMIMAIVIGIFLHISTTILFEAGEGHRFNLYKMITILIGGGLALIAV